ncbi:MAG: hypothetical protein DI621_08445 [Pseudomonas protegens]|nr:hypothetical protein C1883_29650 [Pseudomonas protegens]PZP08515.1 MAG: hypothetical protein DI621_08445 [Pseudomonas protegens]
MGKCFQQISTAYHHRRSRLAGEEAFKPCAALAGAFAGKPAPTARRPAGSGAWNEMLLGGAAGD